MRKIDEKPSQNDHKRDAKWLSRLRLLSLGVMLPCRQGGGFYTSASRYPMSHHPSHVSSPSNDLFLPILSLLSPHFPIPFVLFIYFSLPTVLLCLSPIIILFLPGLSRLPLSFFTTYPFHPPYFFPPFLFFFFSFLSILTVQYPVCVTKIAGSGTVLRFPYGSHSLTVEKDYIVA